MNFDFHIDNVRFHNSIAQMQEHFLSNDITTSEKISFIVFVEESKSTSNSNFLLEGRCPPSAKSIYDLSSENLSEGACVVFPTFLGESMALNVNCDRFSIILTGSLLGDRIT